jgi:hypothetical protein
LDHYQFLARTLDRRIKHHSPFRALVAIKLEECVDKEDPKKQSDHMFFILWDF